MRLTRCVRGVKPSGQWSKPGSLIPGEALESDDTVKLLNARKHRYSEQAKEADRLEPKGKQLVRGGRSPSTRTFTTAGV